MQQDAAPWRTAGLRVCGRAGSRGRARARGVRSSCDAACTRDCQPVLSCARARSFCIFRLGRAGERDRRRGKARALPHRARAAPDHRGLGGTAAAARALLDVLLDSPRAPFALAWSPVRATRDGACKLMGRTARTFFAQLARATRWRLVGAGALMVAFSFTDAFGILLLLPTLEAAGMNLAAQGSAGRYARMIERAFSALGVTPSLEILLAMLVALIALRTIVGRLQSVA